MTHTVQPTTDKTPPRPDCCPDFPWCTCPDSVEIDDVRRVFRDLEAEGRNPGHYDVLAIAADLRGAAGDRHLDSASDDAWTTALAWHERAPFPVEATR